MNTKKFFICMLFVFLLFYGYSHAQEYAKGFMKLCLNGYYEPLGFRASLNQAFSNRLNPSQPPSAANPNGTSAINYDDFLHCVPMTTYDAVRIQGTVWRSTTNPVTSDLWWKVKDYSV